MAYKKIGIDLGQRTMKICVIEESLDMYRLKVASTYDFDTEKPFSPQIKTFITSFLKQHKIKKADLYFSLSIDNKKTKAHFLSLPSGMKKGALNKAIKNEIESKSLEVNINDVLLKTEKLREEENEVYLLTYSITKELIKDLGNIKGLSIKISSIELQASTIGRLIKGNKVLLDFGHSFTRMYFFKNGNIDEIQYIDISGKKMTEEIIKKENKSFLESEEIKKKGIILNQHIEEELSEEDIEISKIITEKSKELTDEIKRSLRGYELKNDLMFNEVYYIGDGMKIKYFNDFLGKELGLLIKPLELITPNDEFEEKECIEYTMAASSLLAKEHPFLEDLNFKNNAKLELNYTPLIIILAFTTCSMVAGGIRTNKIYDAKLNDLSELSVRQEATISDLERNINSTNSKFKDYNDAILLVDNVLSQKKWLSDILFVLPERTPRDVIIRKINHKNGVVVLNGYSKNYSDIGFLAIALEDLGEVSVDRIDNEISEDGTLFASQNKRVAVEREFQLTLTYRNRLKDQDSGYIGGLQDEKDNKSK